MAKINLPITAPKSQFTLFTGGLDTVSPKIMINPGFVREALNFEEDVHGGYNTVLGYERFDGQVSPSLAVFSVLNFSDKGSVAVGDVLTGNGSGATATVIAITGSAFIITKINGIFTVETANSAMVNGPQTASVASKLLAAQYTNSATDVYRALITEVPGTGVILGVWYYNNTVYAFRNSVGSDVGMYKSSAVGWVQVPLGFEVYFSAGSGAIPAEGVTITKGATSAVLKRLTIESGTFAGGTAAGRLIFASITGGPFTVGAITSGMTGAIVSQETITIPNQNGRFEFINANFKGQLSSLRVYGCDGANRGFEFDGSVFVPLNTGTPIDKPLHLLEHQNHLFFAFGSSAIHSALGNPYNWTALSGAAELTFGDDVVGFKSQPGTTTAGSLAVFCRNKTYLVYGTSAADWNVVKFSEESGAITYSIQKVVGQTLTHDDRGITSMATSQRFGNFEAATISKRIQNTILAKKSHVTESCVSRDKQQYRLFYDDGSAYFLTLGEKKISIMPVQYPDPVLCAVSSEVTSGGTEVIFFGSNNGKVYQMDVGKSFDGEPIDAYFNLFFDNLKSYRVLKKFRHNTFELLVDGYSEFYFSYELTYGSNDTAQPNDLLIVLEPEIEIWGQNTWGNFVWDAVPIRNLNMKIDGDGENIAIKIHSNSDYFASIKFAGAFLEYTPLRMVR